MCLEFCYNLWNLLSMWLFLLIYMMSTAGNNDSNVAGNDDVSIINLNSHVNSISDNLCDYSSFDMCLVFNYMNNQLIYYFITDTISVADQAEFQWLMKDHKNFLQLLEWNDVFDEEISEKIFIMFINKNSDSDCFVFLSDYKNIKINLSDIVRKWADFMKASKIR